MLKPIQSLWIGDRLSRLEQLSIRSFLAQGHPYHLYTYGPVEGVPAGVEIKSASKILPFNRYFEVQNYPAMFSDFFRWTLLAKRGGWWCDLDVIAMRPFDFYQPYVIASQHDASQHNPAAERPTSCVIWAPADSPAMRWMFRECDQMEKSSIQWEETGVQLIARAVEKFGLGDYVEPAVSFCPIAWWEWHQYIAPRTVPWTWPDGFPYAAHLWSAMWVRGGVDREGFFPDSLYEELAERVEPVAQRPLISVIMPTIGRDTLRTALESIVHQLLPGDEIIVVTESEWVLELVADYQKKGHCISSVRYLSGHDYGDTERTIAMPIARGDYLIFADDDNAMSPTMLKTVRRDAVRFPGRPLIYRALWENRILPSEPKLALGKYDTACGVWPNVKGRLGKWGSRVGGDFDFAASTLALYPNGEKDAVWCPEVISILRPHEWRAFGYR